MVNNRKNIALRGPIISLCVCYFLLQLLVVQSVFGFKANLKIKKPSKH